MCTSASNDMPEAARFIEVFISCSAGFFYPIPFSLSLPYFTISPLNKSE